MIIGNQLYLEIMECESIVEVRVDSLPAFFTIGPYIVEIYIYMNMLGDLMYLSDSTLVYTNKVLLLWQETSDWMFLGNYT
ncbi:hypothetical protein NQ317_002252 [Molorchus minor]|uniref:Uncharacterized protein n=1 Tax=Molorchus minor TaxID=1323400 RepID=A0ABQ9IXJ2_9CUCU|nr:hypothetical protein NQ317_002252 [Molorchus minor]